jgi:hypothetical protein
VSNGIVGSITASNGVVSGSSQITELTQIAPILAYTASVKETISQTLAYTASVKSEISDIETYTASLKSVAIVSSSTQIQNYNLFAVTASNNTYYGENTFANKVTHTNGYIVLTQVSQSLNFVDDTAAAAGGVPLGGLYRNGNFIVIRIV